MLNLTQQEYESIVFLTRCVYHDDLVYPSVLGFQHAVSLINGLSMYIFYGNRFNLMVICGSNSLVDWIANLKVVLNITPNQYYTALCHVLNVYKDMKCDKPLVIVGHSLGGGIAEYCASYFSGDVYAITFNGCPVKHLCENRNNNANNIMHLVTKHDILNWLTDLVPGRTYLKHLGTNKYIITDDFSFNPVKSHCNFNAFMSYIIKNHKEL